MFVRQILKYFSFSRSVSEDFSSKLRLAKCNLLIIIFTKHLKIPSYLRVFLIFFLSDSGPSDAVKNTLYRGKKENLCV